MEPLEKCLCISQYLKTHPLLQETDESLKVKYLSVLGYFTQNFSCLGLYSDAALQLYQQTFLGSKLCDPCSHDDLGKQIRKVSARRLRGFKLVSYRYILLLDCLFLCAMTDEMKGRELLNTVKASIRPWSRKRIDMFYSVLYEEAMPDKAFRSILSQLQRWKENRAYYAEPTTTILLTANMSAGKSMLINALIGKSVSKTENAVCTAKCHYIYSKAFEDGFTYENDSLLVLDADIDTLMDDNKENQTDTIMVGTAFRFVQPLEKKLCLIDTPGVNASMNADHQDITRTAIQARKYDILLYIMNGENIGTNDDWSHLSYIRENNKDKKVLFVVNKLDRFRAGEDSITETIEKVEADVKKAGFTNYQICPISAYAGVLAKRALWGETLDDDEQNELRLFQIKFKDGRFDFSHFYSVPPEYREAMKGVCRESGREPLLGLLEKSGLLGLEYVLTH